MDNMLGFGNKKTIWDEIFKNSSQYKDFKPIFKDFFIPDNIDFKKFLANYKVLEHQSLKLFKSYIELTENEKWLEEHYTKNIGKLAGIMDRPLGYEDWFVAAYPDVVNWAADLSDEKLILVFNNPKEEDVMNSNKQIKREYLRMLANEYKKKHELETSNLI